MELNYRLLIIAVIIGAMNFQIAHMQHDNKQSQKYCGSQIGKALSTVCKGKYNTLKRIDRYPRPVQWEAMFGDMPAADEGSTGYPYQIKSEAVSLMGGKRRKKRWGVYNECCEKSCTQEELSSYCAEGKRR